MLVDKTGEDKILGVAYVMPESSERSDKADDGYVLFKEEVDEVPFEEAHWDKQDGRWLGIGEVEKQFENQVAVNMTENLRRKHLIWGAKKVWQTQGTAVVRNLVKQVADGQVLEVGANGAISDGKISGVSAGKISTGTIAASEKIRWPGAELGVTATGAPYVRGDTSVTIKASSDFTGVEVRGTYVSVFSTTRVILGNTAPSSVPTIDLYGSLRINNNSGYSGTTVVDGVVLRFNNGILYSVS